MKISKVCLLLVALMPVGCTARVTVKDFRSPDKNNDVVGIPVRFADRQSIKVYQRQADGSYAKVHETTYALPDQSRMFLVGVEADPLCNQTLTLELNTDGSPKTVGLKSASQGQAALTQLGATAGSIATSAATFQQQAQKAQQAALDQAESLRVSAEKPAALHDQRQLAYHQALEAVLIQQTKIDQEFATMTVEQQVAAESAVRVLKIQANQAARLAGEARPFPAEAGGT